MREGIGKRDVGFAGARKIGVEFDGVADIDGNREWRPAVFGWEGLCILLGMMAGAERGFVPAGGAADADAPRRVGAKRRELSRAWLSCLASRTKQLPL